MLSVLELVCVKQSVILFFFKNLIEENEDKYFVEKYCLLY